MKYIAYVGTYADGIHTFHLDTESGKLTEALPVADAENPSWLVLSPDGRILYSTLETDTFEGTPGGGVCAFAVDRSSGALHMLNTQPTHGISPCHLSRDESGRFLLAANYTSGSNSVFPLSADGSLKPMSHLMQQQGAGPVVDRQQGPHAHFVTPAPGSGLICACDLGADSIFAYKLDEETGALKPREKLTTRLRPGAGPRHMAFHPNGFAYVLTELSCEVYVYAYAPQPFNLTKMQAISTLPEGFEGLNHCAAIHMSKDGRTLYASNRGHNSIAVFHIDEASGRLELIQHAPTLGVWPREFSIDPTGRFLLAANQESDTIVTFAIDAATGRLTPNGHIVQTPKPVCILFMELA